MRQGCWEFNVDADDEVAPLAGLLALGHSEVGEALCEGWTGWAGAADADLLAVDGLHGARPARQGLFEVELDGVLDVVAFAGEEGMCFLFSNVSVWSFVRCN